MWPAGSCSRPDSAEAAALEDKVKSDRLVDWKHYPLSRGTSKPSSYLITQNGTLLARISPLFFFFSIWLNGVGRLMAEALLACAWWRASGPGWLPGRRMLRASVGSVCMCLGGPRYRVLTAMRGPECAAPRPPIIRVMLSDYRPC